MPAPTVGERKLRLALAPAPPPPLTADRSPAHRTGLPAAPPRRRPHPASPAPPRSRPRAAGGGRLPGRRRARRPSRLGCAAPALPFRRPHGDRPCGAPPALPETKRGVRGAGVSGRGILGGL